MNPDELPQAKQHVTQLGVMMCALGALFYCYEYYLRVAPSVMSIDLKIAYQINDLAFGHLAAFYYYAYTPLQLPAGLLMDRLGPRKILTTACICCALGTWAFAADIALWVAQVGRFLVGCGSAFAYVGVLKLANMWLPDRLFAVVAGICTALGMLGGMAGLTSLGICVHHIGWQAALNYAALVGLVLSLCIWCFLKEPPEDDAPTPLMPYKPLTALKQMAANPQMWLTGAIGCFTYLPVSVFAELWAVPYLKALDFSAPIAAKASSLGLLGFAVGGPIWGIISDKLQSRRQPLMLGTLCSAVLMSLLLFAPIVNPYLICVLLFAIAFFASVEILIFAVSNDLNSRKVSATAAAFSNMLVMLGGVVLQPLVGRLLDLFTHRGLSDTVKYTYALSLIPLGLSIAFGLSYRLQETYFKRKI